jgi:hypothetical protein
LFHNATFFGSCIIHILHTGCAKIKKKSGAKGVTDINLRSTAIQLATIAMFRCLLYVNHANTYFVQALLHYLSTQVQLVLTDIASQKNI